MNPNDSFIFWGALYLTPLVWVLLGLGALFTFAAQDLLIGPSHPPSRTPHWAMRHTIERSSHVLLAHRLLLWLCAVVVALMLSGANIVGYWKCQKGSLSRTALDTRPRASSTIAALTSRLSSLYVCRRSLLRRRTSHSELHAELARQPPRPAGGGRRQQCYSDGLRSVTAPRCDIVRHIERRAQTPRAHHGTALYAACEAIHTAFIERAHL